MKHINTFIALLLLSMTVSAQEINPSEVKAIMKKVADWQIEHFDQHWGIRKSKKPHHDLDWTHGALYIGMNKWAAMSDSDQYYEWMKSIAERNNYKLHRRMYHADDHTVGQMYCDLYRKYQDKAMLKPTQERFKFIMMHPSQSSLHWKTPFHQDRWDWCDALFMSPPVWAQLSKITGDKTYLDFMVSEFKATTDFLFDKKESLYYRDESFMGKLDNGTKIFWARGNGWVYAGLVNIMEELDPSSKEYKYFLKIYKKMSKKLLEIQTPEGHWAMSLLGHEFYPTPETSGSSFFTFGMAYGVNNGLLDKETYEPAIRKAWHAMTSCVLDNGMLGYVQPIGAAPGQAFKDKSEVYGIGAFLSAGSEVYEMVK